MFDTQLYAGSSTYVRRHSSPVYVLNAFVEIRITLLSNRIQTVILVPTAESESPKYTMPIHLPVAQLQRSETFVLADNLFP